MNNFASPTQTEDGWRYGALLDVLIVVAVLVAVKQSLLPHTRLYAGPASTLSAMIVATIILWWRGIRWHDLGFRKPESWLKTGFLTVVTIGVMIGAMGGAGWVVDQFIADVGTSGRFDHVEGNLMAYLTVMIVIWVHAAFFEELIFRAFLISRSASFLGGGMKADLIAVTLSAAFFGYRHYYYQGLNGALTIAAVGMALGVLYLLFGRRNLFPLILAHGTIDSLGMTYRFLGIDG